MLRAAGVISTKHPVKISWATGEMTAAITVHAHKFSKSAQEKITKAGGKFEVLSSPVKALDKTPVKAKVGAKQ